MPIDSALSLAFFVAFRANCVVDCPDWMIQHAWRDHKPRDNEIERFVKCHCRNSLYLKSLGACNQGELWLLVHAATFSASPQLTTYPTG